MPRNVSRFPLRFEKFRVAALREIFLKAKSQSCGTSGHCVAPRHRFCFCGTSSPLSRPPTLFWATTVARQPPARRYRAMSASLVVLVVSVPSACGLLRVPPTAWTVALLPVSFSCIRCAVLSQTLPPFRPTLRMAACPNIRAISLCIHSSRRPGTLWHENDRSRVVAACRFARLRPGPKPLES